MKNNELWILTAQAAKEVSFSESIIFSRFLQSREIKCNRVIKRRNFKLASLDIQDLEKMHKQELKTLLYYLEQRKEDIYIEHQEDMNDLLRIVNKFKLFFKEFKEEENKLKILEENINKMLLLV
jgi:hypothetical protein